MGRKKKTETAKVEAEAIETKEEIKEETETDAKAEEVKASPTVSSILWQAKKILVDQYKNPEKRDFHWALMQGWIVDKNGELTENGKTMVKEVEAWEAKQAAAAGEAKE